MKTIMDICADAGLQLTKIGDGVYRSFCVFHNDTGKPNLTVYEKNNSYYCFSCSAGGDTIQFVKQYYGKSYEDAIKHIHGDSLEDFVINALEDKKDVVDYNFMLNKVVSGMFYSVLHDAKDKVKIFEVMKEFDSLLHENKEIDKIVFQEKLEYFSEKIKKV